MLIDTHIWIWWINRDAQLKSPDRTVLDVARFTGIQVSIISCWEVAKLVEYGRLTLTLPVMDWLAAALSYPGVSMLPLSPEIVVDSTQLPGMFHKDPADQIIVATSRVYDLPLMTYDSKILDYGHVRLVEV